MSRKGYLILTFIFLIVGGVSYFSAHAEKMKPSENVDIKQPTPTEKSVDVSICYSCHGIIKNLHTSGKHIEINCSHCHRGLEKHPGAPIPANRPVTDTSWEACGQCHKEQYGSFMKGSYHRPARDEKSRLTNRAPNPFWDKLMMGHGFTIEHALTRPHPWMLIDHLIVDRAYGGRFQGKNGWQYIFEKGRAWDVLVDRYPDSNEHKPFIPQSAAAANPVCLQCKSQDHILDWAYMGDPGKGAKWSRTSNVVELARTLQHGANCFHCHDPHAAKPRIVRDALIDSLTGPDKDTLWHKDSGRTQINLLEMGMRGYVRKIALLERYDTKLQCGQCHVEYTCNPGYDLKNPDTSKYTVTMEDSRTNHIPYKEVFDLYDHYVNKISFLDFRHALTGGLLWKAQHSESETFYNSKHSGAGAGCNDCHVPKIKDMETGKVYTSHVPLTPKVQLKETCLKCHSEWTEEMAKYAIDSIKAYTKGRMRKAEFWLSELIDKIVEAKKEGIDNEAIKKAQDQHLRAHILWEWWTAENSDGFHNPEAARESLTRSIDESQKGIAILNAAMEKKK
ncbi:MAG: ammonia-forming cytochrome c nitrite reductase subunit c552 [Nitrospirae bacterium]|nr:ammonia-forming cytochrome c nitrite reductase subunit c552 [Nitrospirota bacterium]